MTIETWLAEATNKLSSAGIASARLDALILLEDATGRDRTWLLAHSNAPLSSALEPKPSLARELEKKIARRAAHEPLAYIRGKSEFYGREFIVTPATLQPRPETETMLELLFKQIKNDTSTVEGVIDVGTGSGAIAITAKLEHPELEVLATEINKDALKIAKQNAKNLSAEVKFYQGNLLQPIFNSQFSILKYPVILANLPYVPDSHTINQAAMQEPKIAIFGGPDGLDLYRELFSQIANSKSQISVVMTESLPFQHEKLSAIAASAGYKLTQTNDLVQVFSL